MKTNKTNRIAVTTATVTQFDEAVYQVKKGRQVFQVQRRTSKMWDVFKQTSKGMEFIEGVQGLKKALSQLGVN